MRWKGRTMEAREGRVGVVGVRVEVGVKMQVEVGAEGEVYLGAIGRHRRQALVMYRVVHRGLFRDHLSANTAAVYRQIEWTQNLQADEWVVYYYVCVCVYEPSNVLKCPRFSSHQSPAPSTWVIVRPAASNDLPRSAFSRCSP